MSKQTKQTICFKLSVLLVIVSLCYGFFALFKPKDGFLSNDPLQAQAAQTSKHFPSLEEADSSFKYKAWYVIHLGNLPVGKMIVRTDNLTTGFPTNYTVQFVSRIGSSPLLSILKGEFTENHTEKTYKLQQYLVSKTENGSFKEIDNIWTQKKDNTFNLIKDSGATLRGVIPANINKEKENFSFDKSISLFYFNKVEKKNKINTIFFPFSGQLVKNSDIFVKYDDDGFLNFGKVEFEGGGELSFSRIEEQKYLSSLKSVSETLIDFGWFSSLKSLKKEFENLKKSLESCATRTAILNKKLLRYLPQSSYLSYRKIINMSHFCISLNKEINSDKEEDLFFNKLNAISNSVKNLLKESPQELPYLLAYSPDTMLFYNNTISFLWPRIAALITQTAISELENNFDVDKNRKSLVGIQLNIAHMQPRAVVRGQIKLIDSSLNFITETSTSEKIAESSVIYIPSEIKKPLSNIYLNGQAFAKNMDIDFVNICRLNYGKIGLDLGEGSQLAINSHSIRGVWDLQTRIELSKFFAIKATIAKTCSNIYFRIPISIQKAFSKELEQFKSETFGSENELLLSNNVQKKVWILPGKYRIVVTSLVTGSVLSAQEFNVMTGVNTNVNVKIN